MTTAEQGGEVVQRHPAEGAKEEKQKSIFPYET